MRIEVAVTVLDGEPYTSRDIVRVQAIESTSPVPPRRINEVKLAAPLTQNWEEGQRILIAMINDVGLRARNKLEDVAAAELDAREQERQTQVPLGEPATDVPF